MTFVWDHLNSVWLVKSFDFGFEMRGGKVFWLVLCILFGLLLVKIGFLLLW